MLNTDKEELQTQYSIQLPRFQRLVDNIIDAIMCFLKEEQIPFLAVTGRVKEFESFVRKVESKNYENPFDDNEDFCGIRIIIYYPNDLQKLESILKKEFRVLNQEDKIEKLNYNEFGYRSKHYIAKIKKEWASTPNYRSLEEIKFEIQTRTILMHAWAEIEHKLGYKNSNLVPEHLKRKLSRLSAKLEEADEQFQEIKKQIENEVDSLVEKSNRKGVFTNEELNLTTLTALKNYYFPNFPDSEGIFKNLVETIETDELTMQEIINCVEKFKPYLETVVTSLNKPTQSNLLWYSIEIFSKKIKKFKVSDSRLAIINNIRKKANLPLATKDIE